MYLFVVIFAIYSILQDTKIQDFISRKFNKTRQKFQKKQEKNQATIYEIDEEYFELKKVIGKK